MNAKTKAKVEKRNCRYDGIILKQVWKILQYFIAFAGIIIFGGLDVQRFEYENAKSDIESDIAGLAKFEAYFSTTRLFLHTSGLMLESSTLRNVRITGTLVAVLSMHLQLLLQLGTEFFLQRQLVAKYSPLYTHFLLSQ